MKKTLIIVFITLVIIYTGVINLPTFVSNLLNQNIHNTWLQDYGRSQQLSAYYLYQRRHNSVGSTDWLLATQQLAKTSSTNAIELADWYRQNNDNVQQQFWLQQAINLDSKKASLLLAKLLLTMTKYNEAHKALHALDSRVDKKRLTTEQLTDKQINTLLFDIKLSVRLGDVEHVKELAAQLSNITIRTIAVDKTKEILNRYKIVNQQVMVSNAFTCKLSILPIATNIEDLEILDQLLYEVGTQSLGKSFCFATPIYQPLNTLGCLAKEGKRIECQRQTFQRLAKQTKAKYIMAMMPRGGANVNNGILYIDSADTVDVVNHELSHLLGFVDEYPLPINHAKCMAEQSQSFAHNIMVVKNNYDVSGEGWRENILARIPWAEQIKADTPLRFLNKEKWQLGTPKSHIDEIGLFKTNTCQGKRYDENGELIELQVFKPVSVNTQLEYFELAFPKQYIDIFLQAPQRFIMLGVNEF